MKVGLISDIHGNAVALEAVLSDMPPLDGLLCAGDVVGYNPWPAACVDALRGADTDLGAAVAEHLQPDRKAVPTVMGNHDRAVATDTAFRFNAMAEAGVEHALEQLGDDQLRWISVLPERRREFDGRVKVVHGHPDDPDRYTYPGQFSPAMLGEEDVLVLGHTHVQAVRTFDEGVIVNPGSVGQPRDGDPRAAYAVLDLVELSVHTHRVEYDIDRVKAGVADTGLPRKIGQRLETGR